MSEDITPDQAAELKEVDAAAREQANVMVRYTELSETMKQAYEGIVELFGRSEEGPLAYTRSMAITRLEEVVHRINDGMYVLTKRSELAEQAVENAVAKGTVVNFPGVK